MRPIFPFTRVLFNLRRNYTTSSSGPRTYSRIAKGLSVCLGVGFGLGLAFSRFAQADEERQKFPLYIWGNNSHHTVPLTTSEMALNPVGIDRDVKSISFAEEHAALVDSNGTVFGWGSTYSTDSTDAATPQQIFKSRNTFQQVVCGKNKVYAVTSKGEVYCSEAKRGAVPVQIPLQKAEYSEKITKLVAGDHHVVGLSSKGNVYTLAQDEEGNQFGQLGLGHNQVVPSQTQGFERVSLGKKEIVDVAAGENHTLLLSKKGFVYGFGRDNWLQLGLGEYSSTHKDFQPLPTFVPSIPPRKLRLEAGQEPPRVTHISAGSDTSAAVFDGPTTSELFFFGFGMYGQLGHGLYTHFTGIPVRVKSLSNLQGFSDKTKKMEPHRVVDISIGKTHSAAVVDYGGVYEIWIWGSNAFSQFGNGKLASSPVPQLLYRSSDPAQGFARELPSLPAGHSYKVICAANNTAVFAVKNT